MNTMMSLFDDATDTLAPLLIMRSTQTQEMFKGMKELMDGSYGRRHELMKEVESAVLYTDNKDALDLSIRYKGWNVLHIAAYHGSGRLMASLCGGDNADAIDLQLVSSINRPQGASVLMCVAYGKSSALSHDEWTFEQAAFKMVYRMSDEQLNYTDKSGCTALHYAAVHGVVKMVAALIERSIDIEARGLMTGEGEMTVGIDVRKAKRFVEGEGWEDLGEDTTARTPLEMAEMRHEMMSEFMPHHANSQVALREVIRLLKQATPQPDVPTAVPVITTMLTVATVLAGEMMRVATPTGALPVMVPHPCIVGTFFQFELPEPIPVADFRAWPRDMAVQTITNSTTTSVATDFNGDGLVDQVATTTTTTTSTMAPMKDTDGDGMADGVVAIAAS